MSATSEMLHRHRQAVTRLAALRADLAETLRSDVPSLPAPSLDEGQTWAELLCLVPELDTCMQDLQTAVREGGPFMDLARELDRLGWELCRLHRLASGSTGPSSSELMAASKGAVEALLGGLTEWTSAAAQTEEGDKPLGLTTAYPSQQRPSRHDVDEAATVAAMTSTKTRTPMVARQVYAGRER